jgi:hypothetical protein
LKEVREEKLFFKPIETSGNIAYIPDSWKVDFLASAGEMSLFFTELKENARLMGTRCPLCGSVYFWPRSWCHECYADCEWLEIEGSGTLVVFSRVDISLSEIQRDTPFYQGGVLLDGVRYPVVALLRPQRHEDLRVGVRVKAEFLPAGSRTGRPRDFYFVPDVKQP